MKKKALLFAAAMVGVLTLAGCGSSAKNAAPAAPAAETKAEEKKAEEAKPEETAAQAADHLARIQEAGKVVVAMEGTWAPWTYHDESDELVGFDVEVAKGIAAKLGVEAEFVEGEWDGLFAGLDSGRYDLVVNGVEITDERSEKYDFSEPYGYIHTALITKEDNDEIKTFEDLNGKTTANSINSTYMLLAEDYGANVMGVDSLDETLEMVLSGRVNATLNAEVSFYDYMGVHPEAPLKVVALTDEASLVSIPMVKGEDSASLKEAVDAAIKEMQESGELKEISEKYFGSDISSNN